MEFEPKFSKNWIESLIVILFIVVFLWNGVGKIFDHKLSHTYPHGFYHADAWGHYQNTLSIMETGSYAYAPKWTTFGLNDVIGMYPPLLAVSASIISFGSGLPSYDAFSLLIHLIFLIVPLVAYFIIRRYNVKIALLSLPFFMIQYMSFHSVWTMVSGDWPPLLGTAYAMFFFWSVSYFDLKNFFLISTIFLAAIFFTQASNFYEVAVLSLIFFLITSIKNKKLNLGFVGKLGTSSILAFIISSYYFIIFKGAVMANQNRQVGSLFQLKYIPLPKEFAITYTDFDIFLILLIIGMIISAIILIKKFNFPIIFGISYLVIGHSNILGNNDAIEMRMLWFAGLSIFFGLGAYYSLRLLIKKDSLLPYAIISFLLIILSILLINHNLLFKRDLFKTGNRLTLIDEPHWESLMILRDKTKTDAKVFFFYADPYYDYYNSIFSSSQRISVNILIDEYREIFNNQKIPSEVKSYSFSQALDFNLPYKKSFFKIGSHKKENPELFGSRISSSNICDFDYYVLDESTRKRGREPVIQMNMAIKQKLLEKEWVTSYWTNGIVTILKNDKPDKSGDCVA